MKEQQDKEKQEIRARRKVVGFAVIQKQRGRTKFKMEDLKEMLQS
jgi:hypothetical protein